MDAYEPVLSDHLAKVAASSHEAFPLFYRGLISLRFPIPVAEVLEFRYVSHQLIDQAASYGCAYAFDDFTLARRQDLAHCGIVKATHSDRLLQLLRLIHHFHEIHVRTSEERERELRATLEENVFAQRHSHRYGRATGIVTAASLASAVLMSPPATLMEGLAVLFGYLCADHYYSLSLLAREERTLQSDLNEVLRRRVRHINWRAVVRQTAAILGYARPSRGETFQMDQGAESYALTTDTA
ncbi:MAG: hypothetical protein M0Z76_02680 [Gammaproteobacteria bacterium]|nr:hypothetical protein [Gammaproteobacteria bacterium]